MNSINVNSTTDAEVSSAVESVAEDKEDLPADWQGDNPVLCVARRSLIDEAAATMLGQLTTAHGEGAGGRSRGAFDHECSSG